MTRKTLFKMGTRNLTLVYYKGQYQIVQYGQWNGQPTGQGCTILEFILNPSNVFRLQYVLDNSDKCIIVLSTEERDASIESLQRKQRETGTFMPPDPIESLSRDTGAKILDVVANAKARYPVKIYRWNMDFLADEIWLEWAWVVDLDDRVLEAYSRWNRYKYLEEKSRFEEVLGSEKNLPGLVKRFGFDELPKDPNDFLAGFEESLMDEEDRW